MGAENAEEVANDVLDVRLRLVEWTVSAYLFGRCIATLTYSLRLTAL